MIFELISWFYISLICLIWGNIILKLFFGIDKESAVDFPIVCFLGMSFIGVIAFYISLIMPLYVAVRLAFQIPALLFLINGSFRELIFSQLKKPFTNLSVPDSLFLFSALLMILFICTAPVIHPDTLNYHVFSVELFEKYGTIPGIGNLKPHFGFQSIWFALLSLFSLSLFHPVPLFPLNGVVMGWFIIFLVSKSDRQKNIFSRQGNSIYGIWYLFLTLFCILSWTQIRLTASSLSPDFIAALSVFLSFYFFMRNQDTISRERSDLLVTFFSMIAVAIKLSAAPVLLLPAVLFVHAVLRGKWKFAVRIVLTLILISVPLLIRNIVSTGYPFYPSLFAAIYPFEWKINPASIILLQHYITSYARYPLLISEVDKLYDNSVKIWLPAWWRHLYVIDKTVIFIIAFGILADISFFRTWLRSYSKRTFTSLLVAITGVIFWFIEAPDPRFGTGFLLPLIYFQYAPLIKNLTGPEEINIYKIANRIKYISTFFIIIYIGYRAVYFFRPQQLLFPEGINYSTLIQPGCDGQIKKMILDDSETPAHLDDSCKNFIFRGRTIRDGFNPAP